MSDPLPRAAAGTDAGTEAGTDADTDACTGAEDVDRPRTPAQVRGVLRAGNARFRDGRGRHPHQAVGDRTALIDAQHPFAVVLGCSDARVPVSVVFDQGLGDLFVVRVAGHVLGDNVIASVRYAVEQLGVPFALVLGHRGCGAVGLAVDAVRDGGDVDVPLLRDIAPSAVAAWQTCDGRPAAHEEAVRRHADRTAERLRADPALATRIASGRLEVASAVYDLSSGRIDGL